MQGDAESLRYLEPVLRQLKRSDSAAAPVAMATSRRLASSYA